MHKTSVYYKDKNGDDTRVMEEETPFSPIGRAKMSYDISDTNAQDDEGVIHPTVEPNRSAKGKGKGKGKAKGKGLGKSKTKRSPKDPEYMVVPPFGAAVQPYAIVMYTINSFDEATNSYYVRSPAPMER